MRNSHPIADGRRYLISPRRGRNAGRDSRRAAVCFPVILPVDRIPAYLQKGLEVAPHGAVSTGALGDNVVLLNENAIRFVLAIAFNHRIRALRPQRNHSSVVTTPIALLTKWLSVISG